MAYFSERTGLRKSIQKTNQITVPMYALIFDCCQRYFDNLAWKYPIECSDGYWCCGLDMDKLTNDLQFEIPDLYKLPFGNIAVPDQWDESFNQYALLDFIEFIAQNIKDISKRDSHSFFMHDHLHFFDTHNVAQKFAKEINGIFSKTGLIYFLNERHEVERVVENEVLTENIEKTINTVKEIGVKELLQEAIALHKSPVPNDNKNAVEKIWDAFERLKTYFTTMDKKASADKIIAIVSGSTKEMGTLLKTEFQALTIIGNEYRIRHHETNKIDITDIRQYDYFFNRCLSIITLSLQYLN